MNEDEIKKRMLEKMMGAKDDVRKEIKGVLSRILDKAAYERLGNIRLVRPELARQLELYLIQLYQSGQIRNVVTDEQLKQILSMLTKKKDFKIRRL